MAVTALKCSRDAKLRVPYVPIFGGTNRWIAYGSS